MRYLSLKEREERKLLIIFYRAYTKIINEFDMLDLKYYNILTNTMAGFAEDLLSYYNSYLKVIAAREEITERRVSIFDRALCFSLSILKSKPIMAANINEYTPRNIIYINERLATEAILLYIEATHYSLSSKKNNILLDNDFSFSPYNEEHNEELKKAKIKLTMLLASEKIDYHEYMELVRNIYLNGIIYLEGLQLETTDLLKSKLKLKAGNLDGSVRESLSDDFMKYQKSRRY